MNQTIQTLQRCIAGGGTLAKIAQRKLEQLMTKSDAMAVTAQYRPQPQHSWAPASTPSPTRPRANAMLGIPATCVEDVPTKRRPLVNAIVAPPGAAQKTRELVAEYNSIDNALDMTRFMRQHKEDWPHVWYDLERCHSENPKFRTPIPGHTGRPNAKNT